MKNSTICLVCWSAILAAARIAAWLSWASDFTLFSPFDRHGSGWLGRSGRIHRPQFTVTLTCGGCIDEWHLNYRKPFCHFVFDYVSWFAKVGVVFRPSLFQPWLETVGTISHSMDGDAIEQYGVTMPTMCSAAFCLVIKQSLKFF